MVPPVTGTGPGPVPVVPVPVPGRVPGPGPVPVVPVTGHARGQTRLLQAVMPIVVV